jgi:hypothetical protein
MTDRVKEANMKTSAHVGIANDELVEIPDSPIERGGVLHFHDRLVFPIGRI